MGKALYRKYRSKSLDEIVGQEHITDTLKNALDKGAISHAYLFTGPRGTGKTSIARILAHAINGIEYTSESTHLDIIEIDAASNRRIDEIRELRDKVHIAPTSSKYKVYIIDEVHMLTREAFNALLKTLEEPPAHAIFMLATTEAHKIPDTIMSRTQRYTLKPASTDEIMTLLQRISSSENFSIESEALELIAQHANGSFRDSVSMLDQLSGLSKKTYSRIDVELLLGIPTKDVVNKLLESVINNDQTMLFGAVADLVQQGIDAHRTASALSTLLRESLMNSKPVLPRQTTLTLLKNLLSLTGNSGDYIGLELALLDVLNPEIEPSEQKTAPVKQNKTTVTVSTPKMKSVSATISQPSVTDPTFQMQKKRDTTTAKSHSSLTAPKPTTENDTITIDAWSEMLDAVKQKHNTLHGVLRMAKPSTDGTRLVLSFKFEFHKKQLELPKNRPIIREFLANFIGVSEFSTVVKKTANKLVENPADNVVEKSDHDPVQSISSIFGGAELLD